jgi:hypothetical protein
MDLLVSKAENLNLPRTLGNLAHHDGCLRRGSPRVETSTTNHRLTERLLCRLLSVAA